MAFASSSLFHPFDDLNFPETLDLVTWAGCLTTRSLHFLIVSIPPGALSNAIPLPKNGSVEYIVACDTLIACALSKPSKSIFEVETDSVKRKLKDKAFARGVNRDDVRRGAEELGVPIEEHIAFCIEAMKAAADALGLRGAASTSA